MYKFTAYDISIQYQHTATAKPENCILQRHTARKKPATCNTEPAPRTPRQTFITFKNLVFSLVTSLRIYVPLACRPRLKDSRKLVPDLS